MAIEPAASPAPTPLRPAEEVAREMVREPEGRDILGAVDWTVSVGVEPDQSVLYFAAKGFAQEASECLRREFASAITRAREEGAATALVGQQPRDLAGRIRAALLRWTEAWASLGELDLRADAAMQICLKSLRKLYRATRGSTDAQAIMAQVAGLREMSDSGTVAAYVLLVQLADELEAIVRECAPEEKR